MKNPPFRERGMGRGKNVEENPVERKKAKRSGKTKTLHPLIPGRWAPEGGGGGIYRLLFFKGALVGYFRTLFF
jgi:hypothetical protein